MFLIRFTQTSSSWYFYVLNQLSAHGKNIWQRKKKKKTSDQGRALVLQQETESVCFGRRLPRCSQPYHVFSAKQIFTQQSAVFAFLFLLFSQICVTFIWSQQEVFKVCVGLFFFFFFREIPQDTSCLCVFNCCCKMSKVYSVVTRLL